MGGKLGGCVVSREEIDACISSRLFEIFRAYYTNVDRATFDRDQAEKDWVLLLNNDRDEIQGFTTLKLYDVTIAGRPIRALFSGNTIIDRAYWGDQELPRIWFRFVADLREEEPDVPLYWFLISSGYRTYTYLHLFYREFFPCYDRPTPPFEREFIDTLGRMKYPDEYRDGIVHVAQPRECLRTELAVPPPHKLMNPQIRFFVDRNPGYLRGDELVCVAEYSVENSLRTAHEAAIEAVSGKRLRYGLARATGS